MGNQTFNVVVAATAGQCEQMEDLDADTSVLFMLFFFLRKTTYCRSRGLRGKNSASVSVSNFAQVLCSVPASGFANA